MSVIFGVRRLPGEVVTDEELLHLAASTERYAPDGTFVHAAGRIGMGFQPYYTTTRSRLEAQPAVDEHGNVLVFDGRIDNYQDLRSQLGIGQVDVADSNLVLAAFLRWGEDCFSRFIGDWAIVLWSAADEVLYLSRDHAGTRTLYFQNSSGTVQWSTYLEQFLGVRSTPSIDEQYAASYLGSLPIGDLTPYHGVRAVRPAHYLVIEDGKLTTKPHWKWMTDDRVRYTTETEYERHFLSLFKTAVERRAGPGAPIVAHLSGGMDSTSIVCISDCIRRAEDPTAELLDTLSLYDDSEPDWNERPYFSITEARRGKVGIHIEMVYADRTFEPSDPSQGVYLFPGADSGSLAREKQFQRCLEHKGYRVILSGMGGDELLGGVPTPLPELADYLVARELKRLLTQTTAWCLADRTPILDELIKTAGFIVDLYRRPHIDRSKLPPWLTPRIREMCIELGRRDMAGSGHLGLRPSAVCNGQTWWTTIETLPHLAMPLLARYEYRYPYLDRDLVEFLFCVPREQLVRPGRRRSLMRRALREIVPTEILERRRKAFLIRGPLALLQESRGKIEALFADSCAVDRGFIDPAAFRSSLQLTVQGVDHKWRRALMNTVSFELWLRAQGLNPKAVNSAKRSTAFISLQHGADKLPEGQIAS
jgi:asparagine synthase (glutamine-hydrolysing)